LKGCTFAANFKIMEQNIILNIVDANGIIIDKRNISTMISKKKEKTLLVKKEIYYDFSFISPEYIDILTIEQKRCVCEIFTTESMWYRSDVGINNQEKRKIWNSVVLLSPKCECEYVYRYLHKYDKMDVCIGEIITIEHSLITTTIGQDFRKQYDYAGKYIIRCKLPQKTKAHDVSVLWSLMYEEQVNFEEGTSFLIDQIKDVNGKPYIYMHEI
jgi:hypothetical protein